VGIEPFEDPPHRAHQQLVLVDGIHVVVAHELEHAREEREVLVALGPGLAVAVGGSRLADEAGGGDGYGHTEGEGGEGAGSSSHGHDFDVSGRAGVPEQPGRYRRH
jgi:hypothetical protein